MATYSDFQDRAVSEKITLATIDGSKQLKGWVLESGAVFRLNSFEFEKIIKVSDDNVELTSVSSLASVVAGTYFHDRENKILYAETTDSANPSSKFFFTTVRFFFSNIPVNVSHDLATGFDVHWKPQIDQISEFGVQLDNSLQLGLAIEGKGSLSLFNDQDFWPDNYDKLTFENHSVFIHSWGDELDISEAKLIYQGRIERKSYTSTKIKFTLKDLLSEIRADIPLASMGDLSSVSISESIKESFQRRLYGRLFGFVPHSVDEPLDSILLSGTISITTATDTVTGVGTDFLDKLSPEDKVLLNGVEFVIATVDSDTSFTLTETFDDPTISGAALNIIPELPKNFVNRNYKVAGHVLRQPTTTVASPFSLSTVILTSTIDLRVGDTLFFGVLGSGEQAVINTISGNVIRLETTLNANPNSGTVVFRPFVQDVKINNITLRLDRDYTIDPENVNSQITLKRKAEFNVSPIREVIGTLSFTNSSRTVTGTDTFFTSQIQPGNYVRRKTEVDFFEVLAVVSDTELILRTASTYTSSGDGQYRPVRNFDLDTDVLSCSPLGITSDGTKDGSFLFKASDVVKDLLTLAGLASLIDSSSFSTSAELSETTLGLSIPATFSDTKTPKFRDTINQVNQSVFGSLVQNNDFKLEYNILSPRRLLTTSTRFVEHDILSFSVNTIGDKIVGNIGVEFLRREHDPTEGIETIQIVTRTSKIAQFMMENKRLKTITTLLVFDSEAQVLANRFGFLLEIGSSVLNMKTKLQGSRLEINDILDLDHENMYKRFGGDITRKIGAIQSVKKSGSDSTIQTEDLASAFNRVAVITPSGSNNFDNSSEEDKIYGGYITDSFGTQSNDSETFGINLIW